MLSYGFNYIFLQFIIIFNKMIHKKKHDLV